MTKQLASLTSFLLCLTACGSDASTTAPASTAASHEDFVWSTNEITVEGGQERYVCFTKTLDREIVVNGYSSMPQPFVHHLVFARTLAPEPEGLSECDATTRLTWDPIYASGAGKSQLDLPSDAGHKIAKGTQLLAQLHLLNSGDAPVSGVVNVRMRLSDLDNPRPVNMYVFGSAAVKLPAMSTSQVVGDCSMTEPVELIAGLPHMHQLGTSLLFEAADSDGTMQEVFKRDPFDFDDQHIDSLDPVKLSPGDMTRVTCEFNNTRAHEVTYGESTKSEMCFFVAFAIDRSTGGACVASPPMGP